MNILSKILYHSYVRTFHQVLIDRNRDRHRPQLGRITKIDVNNIVEGTLKNFQRLIQNVDLGKTYGSRVMVRNGVLSQSLYQVIRNFGADKEYATELCSDILWKIYKKQVLIQRILARFMSRDPQKQMNRIQKFFLFFPLAKPGYDWKINEMGSTASYDIHRCPVCDYFKTQNQEDFDFFRNSWCTFDFPLAEYLVQGGKHQRSQTLSSGDNRCDMKWMV